MKKPKLFLTGLMGSGKTTIGKLLAKRLGWDFFDTDLLVEKKAGAKIAVIFSRLGEARFRRMEASALARVARDPRPAVISTGGGAPALAANRRLMRARGIRIHLQISLRRIFKRLGERGLKKRPLLAQGGFQALRKLSSQRAAAYRQAEILVRAGATPERVVSRILRRLREKNPGFFS
jgi:shikimate kinase